MPGMSRSSRRASVSGWRSSAASTSARLPATSIAAPGNACARAVRSASRTIGWSSATRKRSALAISEACCSGPMRSRRPLGCPVRKRLAYAFRHPADDGECVTQPLHCAALQPFRLDACRRRHAGGDVGELLVEDRLDERCARRHEIGGSIVRQRALCRGLGKPRIRRRRRQTPGKRDRPGAGHDRKQPAQLEIDRGRFSCAGGPACRRRCRRARSLPRAGAGTGVTWPQQPPHGCARRGRANAPPGRARSHRRCRR